MPSRSLENKNNFIPVHQVIIPLWPTEVDECIRPKKPWNTFVDQIALHDRQPGCALGCIYCNQQWMDRNGLGVRDSGILSPGDAGLTINLRVNFGEKTVKEVSISQVIELLRNYPLYNRDGAILIGNYTDPGLDWQESCELAASMIDELQHSGPILYITKMPVGKQSLEHLQALQEKGGKVIVIVTYSGMPKEIEPASATQRIKALERLHQGGIPTILSMRPMITGINGTQENISQVLADCGTNADAVIFGGLFVYGNTAELFAEAGRPLPESYASHDYTVAKKNDEEIARITRSEAKKLGIEVPIYEHTNCAVSYIQGQYYARQQWNKLAHWSMQAPEGRVDDFEHCAEICPACQMKNCVERSQIPVEQMKQEVKFALIDMGLATSAQFESGAYEIVQSVASPTLYLIKNAAFNVMQLFPIMEKVGVRVDNWPTREQFVMRSFEALQTHLGLSGSEIIGAVPFGQEWVLLVDGDLTGDDNVLASKYVRTTSRCRSNVLNIAKTANRAELEKWMTERNYINYIDQFIALMGEI